MLFGEVWNFKLTLPVVTATVCTAAGNFCKVTAPETAVAEQLGNNEGCVTRKLAHLVAKSVQILCCV
jgi:hypothetical protein